MRIQVVNLMQSCDDKKNKIEIINSICKKYNIILMYLFGSQKENAFRILNGEDVNIEDPLADIDVGIVFSYDINDVGGRYRLYSDIYNDLVEVFPRLDLVFLQENHSVFQTEAILGICIYAEEEFLEKGDLHESFMVYLCYTFGFCGILSINLWKVRS